MRFDEDIKIAGDRPSRTIENSKHDEIKLESDENVQKAKIIGEEIAQKYMEDTVISDDENFNNAELLLQRRLLLSFTATVGFETYINDDSLAGIAQKSFLDYIKKSSAALRDSASDTGAFSFYYLAFRRKNDTERRIGQTFAMLCSHDGDPIFQELGEALYCWFLSVVKDMVSKYF